MNKNTTEKPITVKEGFQNTMGIVIGCPFLLALLGFVLMLIAAEWASALGYFIIWSGILAIAMLIIYALAAANIAFQDQEDLHVSLTNFLLGMLLGFPFLGSLLFGVSMVIHGNYGGGSVLLIIAGILFVLLKRIERELTEEHLLSEFDGAVDDGQLSLFSDADLHSPERGFVYIVRSGEYYKIGMTRGDVEKRVATLQTGSPRRLHIVKIIETEDPATLEKDLHGMLNNKRGRGEWFKLSEGDLRVLKRL